MSVRLLVTAGALALGLGLSSAAFAQQGGMQPGMGGQMGQGQMGQGQMGQGQMGQEQMGGDDMGQGQRPMKRSSKKMKKSMKSKKMMRSRSRMNSGMEQGEGAAGQGGM